jgi:hypothetical protein
MRSMAGPCQHGIERQGPQHEDNFLTSWATVIFLRILHDGGNTGNANNPFRTINQFNAGPNTFLLTVPRDMFELCDKIVKCFKNHVI